MAHFERDCFDWSIETKELEPPNPQSPSDPSRHYLYICQKRGNVKDAQEKLKAVFAEIDEMP